jgi:predicted aconitase
VRIPTITDPRSVDPAAYRRLRQTDAMAAMHARLTRAFEALGVLLTDTCINYQTIFPPLRGEHLAMGDTGVAIYANSVQGAFTNFEGGPSALAAGLTGRTPRYGYHLARHRCGTRHFAVADAPRSLSDWAVLGGIIGRATNSYWEVPVVSGIERAPNSDEMKHFGAALASFGSVALFHMPGITPEAATLTDAFRASVPAPRTITRADLDAFYAGYAAPGDTLDVVVFSAPQLSLFEMRMVAEALAGRRIHPDTALIVTTSPEIKSASDRMGLTRTMEEAGAMVLSGACFYQAYAREIAEANGWRRLMTNSAKLVNILGGYGYQVTLSTFEHCVDSAVAGKIL